MTNLNPSTQNQQVTKNILYVHLTSGIGGGTTCLYNLLAALDREKYNPNRVVLRGARIYREDKTAWR